MRILLAAIAFLFLTGCAKVVKDFVDNTPPPVTPGVASDHDDDRGIKLSPGSVIGIGTNMSMRATITPTNRVLTGSNMSAVMSLHKSR